MLRRTVLALAIALAIPTVFAPAALAECMDSPPRADERVEISHAFTATVIEASNTIDPAHPDSAEFNWHVELRVERVYRGEIPRRLAYNGWSVGCHELQGDRLHTGDRLFIASNVFVAEPSPPGADPFAWIGAHVLAWRRTEGGWRFYEDALDYGFDRAFYPAAARRATTTAEILRLTGIGFVPDTATDPDPDPVEAMWVAVTGPHDWAPDPGYSLEIGEIAYSISANNGGGVTSVAVAERTVVRLRRLPDCVPIVRFAGRPGGRYVIRLSEAATPRVEDWTGRGLDTGPALTAGPRTCLPLPDTATQGDSRDEHAALRSSLVVLSFLLGLIVVRRRLLT
jgi:hypothetical protein